MRYGKLGDSDLEVSDVCLGTMTFGEQNGEGEGHEQLDMAFDRGVNFIDTAEMYPVPARAETQGSTERIVGSWLKQRRREDVILATKVIGKSQMTWIREGGRLNREHIRAAIETSLTRLQTDYVDLYQIHWPDRYVPKFGGYGFETDAYYEGTPILETMQALDELRREGKIRYYGLSNETPWGVGEFVRLAKEHGLSKPVSIQNAYSLLNRTFDPQLAETSFHENIPLLAYSPLAFGFLTGKYRHGAMPEGSRVASFKGYPQRYLDKPNKDEAIEAYAALAGGDGLTAMALRFVRERPFCQSVIIGATNLEQLDMNLRAFEGVLSTEQRKGIEDVHRRYPNPCP